MVSKVLTTLCSGHHLGEGSRCQVPAADSQQGLQVGVGLQFVEPLVPGKQHFQMLITSKLDYELIERRRKTVVMVFFIPSPVTGHTMHPLLDHFFFKGQVQGLGSFLTRFPLKFAKNNDVDEIVI